jgi:Rrf2 family iron-sulfur cluster assembly transcriptional regulator
MPPAKTRPGEDPVPGPLEKRMNITTKSRYGLRAVLDIACFQERNRRAVRRKDIGAREGFSQDYLEQILIRLREAKIVQALRGPGGGYRLARPAEEITVWEVMAASEDRLEFVPCLGIDEPECGRHTHCSARPVWQRLNQVVQAEMRAITIADILNGRAAQAAALPPAEAPAAGS